MLGNILKLIRISKNMSLSQVSRKTNLKISLIEDMENGKAKLSLSTLNIFSDFYEIPVSKILLLNDFHERFMANDEKMLNDIKNYYSLKEEMEQLGKIMVKTK